jgi:hypothetical protein
MLSKNSGCLNKPAPARGRQGCKAMIILKQNSVTKYKVLEGKKEVDEKIEKNFKVWERGNIRRAYLGEGKDKSYYDLNEGIFVLSSRTYKSHLDIVGDYKEEY